MLVTYRRHNPARCRSYSRSEYRCKCPIWASGTLPTGQRIRRALKGRDWNKAQDIVRRWEVDNEKPLRPQRITIEEWQKQFMDDAEARHLSQETQRKYALLFKQLQAFAKDKGMTYVDSLDLNTLTEFRSSWSDGSLSASKKLERLRSILKFALVRKQIQENRCLI